MASGINKNLNVIILLTGTINPMGMSKTKLLDKEIRKLQYIDSIKFYLQKTNLKIVFIENSNENISSYFQEEINNNRIEILTFNGNNYPKYLGKGFGELKIIEYGITNSNLIKDCDFIIKITGRLIVLNINKFIKQIKKSSKIELLLDLKVNLTYSESRLFGCYKNFFNDYFFEYQNYLDDSKKRHFEDALLKSALIAISEGKKYEPFKNYLNISGYSGTNNKNYKESILKIFYKNIYMKLKYKLICFS
ncbi:MAG: hypothetical protein BGO29_09405 [Bacteroidales bacterium 36-12]|nr:MAG: hypothetical protein BGO29_09405 [Bacteroidales bacterium 36-12]